MKNQWSVKSSALMTVASSKVLKEKEGEYCYLLE